MSDIERELGRLAGETAEVKAHVTRIHEKLDKHIEDEGRVLENIQHQLSLARFLWLAIKAVGLTVVFAFAFKFGDISHLWKELK